MVMPSVATTGRGSIHIEDVIPVRLAFVSIEEVRPWKSYFQMEIVRKTDSAAELRAPPAMYKLRSRNKRSLHCPLGSEMSAIAQVEDSYDQTCRH